MCEIVLVYVCFCLVFLLNCMNYSATSGFGWNETANKLTRRLDYRLSSIENFKPVSVAHFLKEIIVWARKLYPNFITTYTLDGFKQIYVSMRSIVCGPNPVSRARSTPLKKYPPSTYFLGNKYSPSTYCLGKKYSPSTYFLGNRYSPLEISTPL